MASNGKWIGSNYLDRFGLVKFAETNSLNVGDFERSLHHYLLISKQKYREFIKFGEYKFGEIENDYINDFIKSFNNYFT